MFSMIHICIYTYVHIHTHTGTHVHTPTPTHTPTRKPTRTPTHTVRIQSYTDNDTHKHICAHIYIHTVLELS